MQQGKFLGIRYLRGIAALMVAYLHVLEQIDAYRPTLSGPSWIRVFSFSAGVDIFF
jgi:peptidoglycan/LPS O-acetylase OafA/YrhL